VSAAAPGGDAADPHRAALSRQLEATWGARNDKDDLLHAPTPDWRNWKRVRFLGVDHFTGFRYGDEHHVVGIVFVQDVPRYGEPDALRCLRQFETWARPQIRDNDVELGEVGEVAQSWERGELIVRWVDGKVPLGFSVKEFSAAWAAYGSAYPDACLVYAMAVPWDGHGELAKQVRDRWVREGFQRMLPLTPERPVRK
jgi:hypothetical protein